MRKILAFIYIIQVIACGIIEDTSEETVTYTYLVKNGTGVNVIIMSDFGRTELIPNGHYYQCETIANLGYVGGLCSGELEIRIDGTNLGYRCLGFGAEPEGLCFVEDNRIFTLSEGTIFTETKTRTYEYVLTPDLLENAFELPQ